VVTSTPDYSFLWTPRWILSHLFVLSMVVVMVNLGLWQLGRLDERKAVNDTVAARTAEPPAPVAELLPAGPGATDDEVDAVAFRTVTVSGTYVPDQQVLVTNRTYDGSPGYWVLTPLAQADGSAVVVNRGWVPFNTTDPDGSWDAFAPPSGPVTVTGMVRAGQARSSGIVAGPVDEQGERLTTLARADIGRMQEQVPEPLFPLYVDLRDQQPAQPPEAENLPLPVPEPELSEGPHLSYAGQWFIFATLTLIVYPLLLRRVARTRGAAYRADDAEVEGGPTGGPTGGLATGDDPDASVVTPVSGPSRA
jgi:surfeit locus 1 family protein